MVFYIYEFNSGGGDGKGQEDETEEGLLCMILMTCINIQNIDYYCIKSL